MKPFYKIFLSVWVILSLQATTAHGQAMWALIFGGKIQNDKLQLGIYLAAQASDLTNTPGEKDMIGLAIGAYTNVKLSDKWSFCNYMAFKSPQGARNIGLQNQIVPNAKFQDSSALIKRKFSYFELLPLMRYNLSPSWGIAAGPRLAYRITGNDFYLSTQSDGAKVTVQYPLKDEVNRFDAGVAADLQYSLKHGFGMKFNLRYTYDFVDIYKSDVPISAHNRYFSLGVGIPLGVKKQSSNTTGNQK
jgi:hypothetical protein